MKVVRLTSERRTPSFTRIYKRIYKLKKIQGNFLSRLEWEGARVNH